MFCVHVGGQYTYVECSLDLPLKELYSVFCMFETIHYEFVFYITAKSNAKNAAVFMEKRVSLYFDSVGQLIWFSFITVRENLKFS